MLHKIRGITVSLETLRNLKENFALIENHKLCGLH